MLPLAMPCIDVISASGRAARAQLAGGLERWDANDFVAGMRGFLGLGEGLTPAGDDCLVGALAATHRVARSWLIERLAVAAALASAAAVATTAISRGFIAHAFAGHFAEAVIAIFTAEAEVARRAAVAHLAHAAATSGADTLLGVDLALAALAAR
jgi:hypothetical protein